MPACPSCGKNSPPRTEFCPSCLAAIPKSELDADYSPPQVQPPPNAPAPGAPAPRADLMRFSPRDVDSVMLIFVAASEFAAGVTFGVPFFHAQLRAEYLWLSVTAAVIAVAIMAGIFWLRSRHFGEEDEAQRAKAKVVKVAGAQGGVAIRDHAAPNRHLLIAAVVLFTIGAAVGAGVHVNP